LFEFFIKTPEWLALIIKPQSLRAIYNIVSGYKHDPFILQEFCLIIPEPKYRLIERSRSLEKNRTTCTKLLITDNLQSKFDQ
jgi:hypothetical protein